ncbi:glycosyltransferase family 4 protein [Nocardioides pacificus]
MVFPELRSEQVNLLLASPAVDALCLGRKWDLGDTPLPRNAIECTTRGAIMWLFRRRPAVVEIPEPLFLRELPRSVLLAASARIVCLLTRRPVRVVTYAIENNDLHSLVGLKGLLGRVVVSAVRPTLATVMALLYDQVIFGSDSAFQAYNRIAPRFAAKGSILLELPKARAEEPSQPDEPTVIFVGELARRKGLPLLIEAWPLVEEAVEGARLHIVGAGPLESEVNEWCRSSPSRAFLGLIPHHTVASVLQTGRILVAPSIRDGRWREQIGRPISEGLASGLTIVTTTETGLADWLSRQGHYVLPAAIDAHQLAAAIVAALGDPLGVAEVQRSLPPTDGRFLSHTRLHPRT